MFGIYTCDISFKKTLFKYTQGSYRIFNIIFPEFLMISTRFSLSFPIKIGMFFPESVVCKSHEVYAMANGHCSLQLGSGGALSGSRAER